MDELESQIAKIQLGNFKHTNSYVNVTAEKTGSGAELYVISELPLLNPAARESCEKICLAIASTLKRAYRRQTGGDNFENAISLVNEELGKLAGLGQTVWVDKLNCIIGIKEGKRFTIATAGKVSAFLFRAGEFTDISCSSGSNHPLKTFENYANGRIKLGDMIILSTTQLFNYLSMDRLKNILSSGDFLASTQTIIEILKESAGPEVAFGTILNLQVPLGQTSDEEVDLESYVLEKPMGKPGRLKQAWTFVKGVATGGQTKRIPKVDLPKVSFAQRLRNFGGSTKHMFSWSRTVWRMAGRGFVAGSHNLNLRNFRNFSPQKKFFLISALVLLLAFVINIFVAVHYTQSRKTQQQITENLKAAQALLTNAESAILYKDQAATASYITDARAKLNVGKELNSTNQDLFNQMTAQLKDMEKKTEKAADVKVTDLGGLGKADSLIKAPGFVAVQINGQIVSYNKNTGKLEDGAIKSPADIYSSIAAGKNTAVIYSDKNLMAWDYSAGKISPAFSQNVPGQNGFGGLAYYPTNSRVYVADKNAKQIINFVVSDGVISKPVVTLRDAGLADAIDIAIDGSVYILTSSGIKKFQAGKPADFSLPFLFTPFSGKGKLQADVSFQNLYLLDSGNNRVIVMDKKGNLVNTIKTPEFTDLKDFQVDEKNKTIYLLNGASLLKVTF